MTAIKTPKKLIEVALPLDAINVAYVHPVVEGDNYHFEVRMRRLRALAYRLYTLCERKGWAEDARAYNELVTAWTGIEQASAEAGILGSQSQLDM